MDIFGPLNVNRLIGLNRLWVLFVSGRMNIDSFGIFLNAELIV